MEHFSSDMLNQLKQNMIGQGYQGVREPVGQMVANSVLLDLKPGESFQGEIASVGGDEVILKLVNGQFLSARLEGDIQFALGQMLAFQVQSNQNAKLVLKPVFLDQTQRRVGESALKTAGIAMNDKNMQMVSSMMEQGISVDKNTMQAVYRLILQNPQQSMNTILQLFKLQLPVNEATIHQIESYQNMTYQLECATENISKEIAKLLQSFTEKSVENDISQTNQFPEQTGNNPEWQESMVIQNHEAEAAQKADQTIVQQELSDMSGEKQPIQVVKELLQIFTGSHDEVMNGSHLPEDAAISEKMNPLRETEQAGKIPETQGHELHAKELITMLDRQEVSFSEFGKWISEGRLDQLNREELSKVFSSKEWKHFLQKNLQKEWSIAPEEVAQREKIDFLYKRIQRQSMEIGELLEETLKGIDAKPKAVQNLQQNLDFMNHVNQIFQYVQLPLKWKEGQAHGDLYVFTNKKNLAQRDGTVTAFLHLDMEQLGSVDVQLALELKKSKLQISFEIDEQEIPFFQQYLPELDNRLQSLGYQVKSSAKVREQQKNIVQRMEESKGIPSTVLSYQKFDMRT